MNAVTASKTIPASVQQVFDAIQDPKRLARWWGPEGFTNTFNKFEFKPGGKWVFTMHGPDGKSYANESIFEEIVAPKKVVILHICLPVFVLTIELTKSGEGTLLSWNQEFEDESVVTKLRDFLTKANNQNLDRLTQEVASTGNSGDSK
ncbi:MAG: SRPBCC domain-containing protein [Candidatus Omnitrophica bacterium]|nr:SRPBCC domain-containing protein [Candidatus Omnitrophota bacterium]